jgi:hypothetical protein
MRRKIKLKERIFMNLKFSLLIPILFLFFSNFALGAEVKILVMDGGGECKFCDFITDLEKEGYSIFAPACDVPPGLKIQNFSYSFISQFNILILRSANVEGKEWNEDVKKYVEGGGRLIIISDTENFYSPDNPTNHLAGMWGVEFSGDYVGGAETIDHPITKNVKQVSWCGESDAPGIHLCFDGIPSTHPKEAIVLARYNNESALILLKDNKGEVIFGPNNGIMDNKELLLNIFRYFTSGLPEEEVSCKEDEIYNPEIKECIKKGIGCYLDTECYHFYSNSSVICYGSVHNHVNIPGHCCLKNEIWNGTACVEKKLRIVAIPYKKSWEELKIKEEDLRKVIEIAMSYFPIKKERVELIVWNKPCTPLFDNLWTLCPILVGTSGDRYVLIGEDDLSSECGGPSIGCANGVSVIVKNLNPIQIAHELGHTFGLLDEYCHYKHPIFGWICGTEAYPNPLKEEYGCKVFPLPHCESATIQIEKTEIYPGELIKLIIKDLKGNACQAYEGLVLVDGTPRFSCIPGEPCYISFNENERGVHKIKVKFSSAWDLFLPQFEFTTNEVEVNVSGSYKEPPKIFGKTCTEDKLPLSLRSLDYYWKEYAKEGPVWCRINKNSIFEYEIEGSVEIYNEKCEKISSGTKVKLKENGMYNLKINSLSGTSLSTIKIEELGFCCATVDTYAPTCLGNTAISGGGRSIMASQWRPQTHFSKPAWEHLRKVMEIWE